MKSVSDALGFGFHSLVQLPHSGLSFVLSLVGHFKWRQAFDKEAARRLHFSHTLGVHFCGAQHPRQSLVIQGRDVNHRRPLVHGPPAKFVGKLQASLARFLDVVPHRRPIGAQQGVRTGCVGRCDFHSEFPRNRATSTSASSESLPCPERTRSAIFCGGSQVFISSWKSLVTPSVANVRVSPLTTGTTNACKLGSCPPTTPLPSKRNSLSGPLLVVERTSTPSTLPTPSQVMVESTRLKDAILTATPRVPTNLAWQRLTRESTDSPAWCFKVITAVLAACAASEPCPSPSTTAISRPWRDG